ncbi:MAG: hypothetical protein IE932_00045 [Sphingopyxis terrae]|nr:hypothetical protein [Sphingopyxis terrae]
MTDFTQPCEAPGKLLVAIVDETYGHSEDEEWPVAREVFRLRLEDEYGVSFEDADIGNSASFPAFATLIDMPAAVYTLLIASLFAGKKLHESLEGYGKIAGSIRRFFKRPLYLGRDGAAALAIEEMLKDKGGTTASIRLLSYRLQHAAEPDDLSAIERSQEIFDAPATLELGFGRHIFEFEVDDRLYRVSVDGRKVKLLHLDPDE